MHEKERKAICKTVPWYLLLCVSCNTLGILALRLREEQAGKQVDDVSAQELNRAVKDGHWIGVAFFLLLSIWSTCLLVARVMLAIKLPNGTGARNCLVKFFVFLRFIILLALIFDVGLFYLLAYRVAYYTFEDSADLEEENLYLTAICRIVQLFVCAFALIHIWCLFVLPIQRCCENRKSRGCCT